MAGQGQQTGAGCLMAAVVIGVLIIVIAVNGGHSTTATAPSAATARSARSDSQVCTASYPDRQETDVCAGANRAVNLNGLVVTASAFSSVTDEFEGRTLCTTVRFRNTSSNSQDYNEFDFKVQTPSGDVSTESAQAYGGTLGSGTLVAGGSKTGKICANDTGEKGQYVFIYKPNPFKPDRGIWLFIR